MQKSPILVAETENLDMEAVARVAQRLSCKKFIWLTRKSAGTR